jgi:predicted enzyme related to lactoylglutathione lyase
VVWFEIMGRDGRALRSFYREPFDFEVHAGVAEVTEFQVREAARPAQ